MRNVSSLLLQLHQMFDRITIVSVIVRNANALNPNEIASQEVELLQKKMKLICTYPFKLNMLSTNDSDKALEQYSLFLEEIRWLHLDVSKIFDPSKTNLDDFYFRQLGISVGTNSLCLALGLSSP